MTRLLSIYRMLERARAGSPDLAEDIKREPTGGARPNRNEGEI